MGNTCYINSVLSILLNCPNFVSLIQSLKQRSLQNSTPRIESAKKLLQSFQQLVSLKHKVEEGKLGVIQPGGILRLMFEYLSHRKISPLIPFRQNDALECLGVLLDAFEEGAKDSIHNNWESGKVIRDIVRKSDRKVVDSQEETQITWNLQIPTSKESVSLSDCFRKTFEENQEEITYKRDGDSEPVDYILSRKVKETPKLFFIQLIRWDGFQNKIQTPVEVPEILNINNISYQLRGTICHMGSSIPSGHYYSVVLQDNQKIYRIDDDHIQPCSMPLSKIICSHVYGIMYELKSN